MDPMATLHLKRGSRRRQEEGRSRMEAGRLREGVVAGGRRKKEGSRKREGVLQDHTASEHEQNTL